MGQVYYWFIYVTFNSLAKETGRCVLSKKEKFPEKLELVQLNNAHRAQDTPITLEFSYVVPDYPLLVFQVLYFGVLDLICKTAR